MNSVAERKIVVDFEWDSITEAFEEKRIVSSFEIIEMGAVMLDKNNVEISRFQCYVKPRYVEHVSKKVKKLTGITDEKLEDAVDFVDALHTFCAWCENATGSYAIYSWSKCDLLQFRAELALKEITMTDELCYIVSHWYDLQDEFDIAVGVERNMSLMDALYYAGIDARGTAHNAGDDALNAALIYQFLCDEDKQRLIKSLHGIFTHETETVTLGDLFDWSKFGCA